MGPVHEQHACYGECCGPQNILPGNGGTIARIAAFISNSVVTGAGSDTKNRPSGRSWEACYEVRLRDKIVLKYISLQLKPNVYSGFTLACTKVVIRSKDTAARLDTEVWAY
jgi:hypothetical protein